MGPQRSLKIIAIGCAGLGALPVAIAVVILVADPPGRKIEAWLLIGFMLMAGGLFLSIGVGMLVAPVLGRFRRQHVLRTGIAVTARVTAVRSDTSMQVDGQSPWIIEAEWKDRMAGEVRKFTSHRVWVNPRDAYPVGGEVKVCYLPRKPDRYAFELDRLPTEEESIPAGCVQWETDVPLPENVEVEELPDAVRYLLPGDTVIMLDRRRLRSWSGHWMQGKCSRPAHRVRRFFVWQMGIWVECDGWYAKAPLFSTLNVTNPPDPHLLVSVAHDLAKRMARAGFRAPAGTAPLVVIHNDLAAKLRDEFKAFTGELEDAGGAVHYHADSLSYGNVEVWIDLPQDRMRLPPLFFETRSGPFDRAAAVWGAEQIQALLDLGAHHIDVGFHGDEIQVCSPQDRAPMTRELAEQAAGLMAALRRQALG